jgi:hypothetical protein
MVSSIDQMAGGVPDRRSRRRSDSAMAARIVWSNPMIPSTAIN